MIKVPSSLPSTLEGTTAPSALKTGAVGGEESVPEVKRWFLARWALRALD